MLATATHAGESALIYEMMEHLGIEPAAGVLPHLGLKYLMALRRCEGCVSKQACQNWLDDQPAVSFFAPRFCPNAHTLFELVVNSNVAPPVTDTGRVVHS
jgi:hypothetical protein